jgi:class 3 adenylate cyclase/tetratricopeptide (TPR) repeat protein
MKCPDCQFENPHGMKFCGGCGAKLEKICPSCNSSSPSDFKFCGECGHKLDFPVESYPKDLSFDEKLDRVQRYLPRGLTEKILAQKDQIEGERKQVTVMFCDMEGFTQLSEKLGPEEIYNTMDQVYEILIHKVHDYEGTVNELTGDGIMALFGAPIALEDAPQRAIRSSLSIHREIAKYNNELNNGRDHVPPIRMRIGINSGPVVVGTLGNDLRVDFKAVGDTVNLASRMEGLAEPGTTYITGNTFQLTEGLFRFEALGTKKIKGRDEGAEVYRVIAPSTRRTRFDVSAERGLTPFVGRKRELELLSDGFERAKKGHGQAMSIVSEAGVGKSRLLYEFRKAVINEDATFLEGKCLSYSRNVAYHPVVDILKSSFDIGEADADKEIKEKVISGLALLDIEATSTLPYILDLLSLKDSGVDRIPMSPESIKDRKIEAVKRITLKAAEIKPLILAVEDLHWIDKSSEEYLRNLLNGISGARVFLIFTYRPEFVHTWGTKSYHSQVNLNRLSNRESLSMVSYLLGTEAIENELEELILEKTEGFPFFIEELVKSLLQLKLIRVKDGQCRFAKNVEEVAIPVTIQDVIMARVDALPEGVKELLQIGSVIGREFGFDLIGIVADLPETKLLSALSALKDSELIYERGIYPDTTYIIKHALTQAVIYNSILTNRKKELHEKTGRALEELYKEKKAEHYGALVEHFTKGDSYEKGADYSELAGRASENSASFHEAITYTKNTIACLERLPTTEILQKRIIDARTKLGLYYVNMNYFADAKEPVESVLDLAIEINYRKRLSQIYTIVGTYQLNIDEDFPLALKSLEEALSIARQIKHIPSLYFANYWLGCALSFGCEFKKALEHFREAQDIQAKANEWLGFSVTKSCASHFAYALQGNIDLAHKYSEEALHLAEEIGDIFPKAFVYTNYGISCYFKGLMKEAEANLLTGIGFCEKIEYFTWHALSQIYLGVIYFDSDQYEKAKHHYGKSISLFDQLRQMVSTSNLAKIGIAGAKVMNNEMDIDMGTLYRYVAENKIEHLSGMLRRGVGEILLNLDNDNLSEAEIWIKEAIEADHKNRMMWHLGRDYALYAELLRKKGDQSKAKENFKKAIGILEECGADGWVKKYEKQLATLS